MAGLNGVNYNTISALKNIQSEDEISKKLLEVLRASLIQQAEAKGKDVKNLEELKTIKEMIAKNEFKLGVQQKNILDSYNQTISSVQGVMDSYDSNGNTTNTFFQNAIDDITRDIPTIQDISSAIMAENPLLGQSWKVIKSSWNFTKNRIDAAKRAKQKEDKNADMLKKQADGIQQIETNTEEVVSTVQGVKDEVKKQTDEPTYHTVLAGIDEKLEKLSNNNVSHETNEETPEAKLESDKDNAENKVIVTKLDNIDHSVETGFETVVDYMKDAEERKDRSEKLQRLKDTSTKNTFGIESLFKGKDKGSNHDANGLLGLFGKFGNLAKFLKPLLGFLTLTLLPTLLSFLKPFKLLFSGIMKLIPIIGRFLPTLLRLGGKLAIVGTVIMAIWDFVNGFIDSFSVFENQEDVTILDRIQYAKDNIIAGFVKLLDDVLDWFGLGFLDDSVTQEDITKAIFGFREDFVNMVKSSLNMLLDWLDTTFLSALVPSFRFDTTKLNFKEESKIDMPDVNKLKPDDETLKNGVTEIGKRALDSVTSLNPITAGAKMLWNFASDKFNNGIKDIEKDAIKNNNKSSNVVNSGNTTVNNNGGGGSNTPISKNTSNQDLSFRKAIGV